MITDEVKQVGYAKGDALFEEGEKSRCAFALRTGVVKISAFHETGREQIVGIARPGKYIVGVQSLNDERRAYTAIAETDVKACKFRHRTLLNAVANRGEVALRLIDSLTAQLAHSRKLMEVMGHKCASAKIASFINLMIPDSEHGDQPFTLPFSRSEIAGMLGLSEETVCRQMAKMKRRGILYAPRGRITVLDWDKLLAIAEEVPLEAA
jgi:CRP/FNR family transcriptional regulator